MAITAAVRQDIMELAVLMNNSAPGTTLLAELVAKSNAGSSLTEIAEHLAGRAEFTAKYPTFQTATEFANEWLSNALPEADAALLAECVTIVEAHINGGGSIADLVVSVQAFMTDPANADGAVKTHIDNFTNKVSVATYHTITKEAAAEWDIPATVTSNATTVATGNASVDTATAPAAAAGSTKNLTISTDIFNGGSGDDIINATLGGAGANVLTYNANDQIDAGEGTDSIYIEQNAASLNLTTQKGIEKIQVNPSTVATITVTLPSDKAYTTLENVSGTKGLTFADAKVATVDLGLTSSDAGETTTLDYFGTTLTGAADNLDINLNAGGGTVAITGTNGSNALETVTLNSIADSTLASLNLGASATSKLVFTGAGSTTLTAIGAGPAATLNTYDAGAATGAVSFTAINTTANTITGGAGNDSVGGAGGNDTISTGAGEDQVTGAAGNDNVSLGAGNDTMIISAAADVTKNDTIDGGEGTDTLQLAGTLDYSTAGAGTDDASGIKGFEVLSAGAAAVSQDMTGLAKNNTITSVTVGASEALTLTKDTAITDVTITGNSGTLSMASAGTQTVNIAGDTGGTDVPSRVTGASVTSGATAINLVSAGSDALGDNTVSLLGTALTSITVTGTEDVQVTANKSKVLATADFSGSTAEEVSLNASASEVALTYKTGSATDTLSLTTGKGADVITTGDKDDTVTSTGDGADTITMGGGNDTVGNTGKGADKIDLGAGDTQSITGSTGAGNDTVIGGDGNDTINDTGDDDDHITLNGGDDTVTTAGAGNDTIDGGAGNDNLTGGAGADSIVGGAGNDTLSDGTGNDTVTGGEGDDTISISTGNDNVDAGAGNDTISITGLSGADTIDGGAGTDSITITNSSTGTLTPAFKNIESATVNTSSNFTLSLTAATDKTSLTSYAITSTNSLAADDITITDGANNTVVTISDDSSWDGLAAADDTGDIGAVSVGTTAGGTITVNVNANEDALLHAGSSFTTTTITKSAVVNINASNSDSNKIQHTLGSVGGLVIDTAETQTLNLVANSNSGLVVGNINAASTALSGLSFTTADNAASTIGTMTRADSLATLNYTVTGGNTANSSTFVAGVIGEHASGAAQLTSLNAQVTGVGSTMTLDSVDTANSSAITSIDLKANSANSALTLATGHAGVTTTLIDAGTATVASLNITAADNASILIDDSNANATITSGAITAATVSLGNYSTFADVGGNSDDNLVITGAPTALNISLGRDITHAANDEILFSGTTAAVTLTTTLDDDAIAFNTSNQISYGGNVMIDLGTVTKATYTHTGTGTFAWDGTNVGTNIVKANATESTTGAITGGAGNDTLHGNEGAQTITGAAGDDTIVGLGGGDTLTAGGGNDSITAGEGVDGVTGGLGTDSINVAESTQAIDTINITAGAVGTDTDNESKDVAGTSATVVDDRGEDTITGFDAGTDVIAVTATNVGSFSHVANLAVSAPADAGISTTTTGTLNSFVKNTLFIALDADTDYDDDDDIVITFNDFKLNGVDQLAASATDYLTVADVSGRISYNITGDAAGSDVYVLGDLADTITMGAGADSVTLGTGADIVIYTFVTPANAAAESGAAIGDTDYVLNTAGDTITGFVSGTDKIHIPALAVTNAKGTEADTLLTIAAAGTIANTARFVEVTAAFDGTTGDAVTDLAALTTTAVESADSVVVFMHDSADGYLFLVEEAGTGSIQAGEVTLLAKIVGVTNVADGDFVSV